MGRSMGHIAHQPGPVCLEGGVSRWLVGVVGLGTELHPRPHTRRVGRFFNSSALVKRTVPRPSRAARQGLAAMAELRPLFPGVAGGAKPLLFTTHRPCEMCKKKTLVVHVCTWPGGNRKTTGADTPMALSALSGE
jgi:hypothetical protein